MKLIHLIFFSFLTFLVNGQETFTSSFDNPLGSITQIAYDVVELSNGNIYAVSSVDDGKRDIRLVGLTPDGSVKLDTIYEFTPHHEFTPKIIKAGDGGVIVASTSFSYPIDDQDGIQDILVWKISANGVIEWEKIIAARSFHSMVATSDGNYVVFGNHYSQSLDLILEKIDPNGNTVWQQIIVNTWEGASKAWEYPIAILEMGGNIFFSARIGTPASGWADGLLYKMNQDGEIVWQSRIPRELDSDIVRLIHIFKFNKRFFLKDQYETMTYEFNAETGDFWNISDSLKLNFDGYTNACCGYEDELSVIIENEDELILKKYIQLDTPYFSEVLDINSEDFRKVIRSADGGYLILTYQSEGAMGIDKLDCIGNSTYWSDECNPKVPENLDVYLYPNPVNEQLVIEASFKFYAIKLYNSLGELVRTIELEECNRNLFNVSNLSGGMYVLKVEGFENSAISKFVKR